ncbi:hypothetical protein [Micromonospora sp. LOL_023]|uniref:hypothetical protein n=1 Tax=Micromonospora sp. LOL_023 TaxID=3345418 RepID=UPI003A86FBF5
MNQEALAAALRDFADRIALFDPAPPTAPPPATGQPVTGRSAESIEIRVGGADLVELTPTAAEAFCVALRSYHDPRDRGRCDQCGCRRLGEGLQCLDCGQPGGLFGQLVRERMTRSQE